MAKGRNERVARRSFLKCISVFGRPDAAHTSPLSTRSSIAIREVVERELESMMGEIGERIVI